jgi:hypothetical protein
MGAFCFDGWKYSTGNSIQFKNFLVPFIDLIISFQDLRQDERNIFEGSLFSGQGSSEKSEPCVLTGYPVTGAKVSFRTTGRFAYKEDWNRFTAVSRSEPNEQLANIGEFIKAWCGSSHYSY